MSWLQRQLEHTYDISIPQTVDDYVISSRALIGALLPEHQLSSREELLLVQGPDSLDIGLFLDQEVLDALYGDDPSDALHDGNLENFCVALEGVSHFVCVLWKSAHARSVTLLELELQAEVDKYFTAALLLTRQCGRLPEGLVERLFGDPTYLSSLTPRARERYELANRYAAKLCVKLEKRYLRGNAPQAAVQALRRFYRLSSADKLRFIEQS